MKKPGILSLILIFTMLLSVMQATARAEEVTQTEAVSEAAESLFSFGILEEGKFNPAANITRGEFVRTAIRITGSESLEIPRDTAFADVKENNPISGAVAAASDMNIIAGFDDGTFRPEETITKEQCTKILVSLLGYDAYAKAYGGYPGGYLSVASVKGLLKNVTVGDYQSCTWKDTAQLIYNALNCDVLQVSEYPTKKYYCADGENPMTLWLGIYLCEGTVVSTDIAGINGAVVQKKGNVKISGKVKGGKEVWENENVYIENGTGIREYLGYPVTVYFRIDEFENNVLIYAPINENNIRETYINADELNHAKSGTEYVSWFDGNRDCLMPIKQSAVWLYNGKQEDAASINLSDVREGNVVLADLDRDGKAELIKIQSEEIYIVENVSSVAGTITDLYGKPKLTLGNENDQMCVTITQNGKNVDINSINKNDVLSVIKSRDGFYIKIIVSANRIKGTVTEIGSDTISIDGEAYKVAEGNKEELAKLSINDKSAFYFTYDKRLAGYGDIFAQSGSYGYLIAAGALKRGFEDKDIVTFRFYAPDGLVYEYESAEEFEFCGKRKMKADEILNALSENYQIKHQLIKYELDDNNNITKLYTAADNTIGAGGTGKYISDFSLDYAWDKDSQSWDVTYKPHVGIMLGMYDAGDAVCIKIPSDPVWNKFYAGEIGLDELEKQFKIIKKDPDWIPAGGGDYRPFNIRLYDVSEKRIPKVIVEKPWSRAVVEADEPQIGFEFFLVDKVVGAVSDSEDIVQMIYGCYDGSYVRYEIDDSVLPQIKTLKRGDVVRLGFDIVKKITGVKKIFTMSDDENVRSGYLLNKDCFDDWTTTTENAVDINYSHPAAFKWNQIHHVLHVKLTQLSGTSLFASLGTGADGKEKDEALLYKRPSGKVYVYDEALGSVRVGSYNDIDYNDPRQSTVIRMRYLETYEIVIINRIADPGDIPWGGLY